MGVRKGLVAASALLLPLAAPASVFTAPAAQERAGFDDAYTVWLCPMHRDHQAHEEGRCPLCGMALVRRTLVTRYVCLAEEDGVVEAEPGICPDTGDPLVPAIREVIWFCPSDPDRVFVEPGVCEGGAPRQMTTRVSEHGDHNPRHGGVLFMAPDGVHHLEGTLENGAFRLYFYDSFTRPIEPGPFAARVVPADEFGAPVGDPVTLAAAADALETGVTARAGERAAFTAFVRFPERDAEDRFDFIFLSDAERAALAAEAAPTALPELRVPDAPQQILDAIRARDRRVRALIAQGRWADLFIPALEAKELALAYGEMAADRPWVALKRIVRGAWLLDLYGDQGDRIRVGEAYEIFAEGMRGLPETAPE